MADKSGQIDESHFREIEKVTLYISEARQAAERSAKTIAADGAEPHLIAALEATESELAKLHTRLLQQTFFAVPSSRKPDQDELFKVERTQQKTQA